MALSDFARLCERHINRWSVKRSEARGWVPAVTGYLGYGSPDRVRVLGRVLMENPDRPARNWAERGYRQFFTIQVAGHDVAVTAGDQTVHASTNDNGYIDVLVKDHGLSPGWHEVTIAAAGAEPVTAEVLIIDESTSVGIISDVDDTIMVTWLPRALLAAWNSWFKRTNRRQPVPGMDAFYSELIDAHPSAPVFYLSTGAWNTFDTLVNFVRAHRLPRGPMLLTDWGPTPTGLFRNGVEHKKVQLRNLIIDFPHIQWVLVGDDGQHDPLTYRDVVNEHPERIAGVAIRNLSPQEHVLSHGTAAPLAEAGGSARSDVPLIEGDNGHSLLAVYRRNPFDRVETHRTH